MPPQRDDATPVQSARSRLRPTHPHLRPAHSPVRRPHHRLRSNIPTFPSPAPPSPPTDNPVMHTPPNFYPTASAPGPPQNSFPPPIPVSTPHAPHPHPSHHSHPSHLSYPSRLSHPGRPAPYPRPFPPVQPQPAHQPPLFPLFVPMPPNSNSNFPLVAQNPSTASYPQPLPPAQAHDPSFFSVPPPPSLPQNLAARSVQRPPSLRLTAVAPQPSSQWPPNFAMLPTTAFHTAVGLNRASMSSQTAASSSTTTQRLTRTQRLLAAAQAAVASQPFSALRNHATARRGAPTAVTRGPQPQLQPQLSIRRQQRQRRLPRLMSTLLRMAPALWYGSLSLSHGETTVNFPVAGFAYMLRSRAAFAADLPNTIQIGRGTMRQFNSVVERAKTGRFFIRISTINDYGVPLTNGSFAGVARRFMHAGVTHVVAISGGKLMLFPTDFPGFGVCYIGVFVPE